jgi:YCII-related domain
VAKYVFIYKGGQMGATQAERDAQFAAWGQWFGKLGPAIADGGNPFGPSKAVSSAGSVSDGAPSSLSGYSVINADSLNAATEFAKGCPILSNKGSVEVYETIDVM